jgi:hypothetical protein
MNLQSGGERPYGGKIWETPGKKRREREREIESSSLLKDPTTETKYKTGVVTVNSLTTSAKWVIADPLISLQKLVMTSQCTCANKPATC